MWWADDGDEPYRSGRAGGSETIDRLSLFSHDGYEPIEQVEEFVYDVVATPMLAASFEPEEQV